MRVDFTVSEAAVEAVVIRADGRREELGVVASYRLSRLSRVWRRLRGSFALAFTLAVLAAAFLAQHPAAALAAGPFLMDAGKAIITNLVSGAGGTVPKYHAMGTGAGPANAAAAALSAEVETRATGTVTRITTSVSNDTLQSTGVQTATQTRAITEVGLFDASSSGNCLIMSSIAVINLGVGDSLQTVYRLTFS